MVKEFRVVVSNAENIYPSSISILLKNQDVDVECVETTAQYEE